MFIASLLKAKDKQKIEMDVQSTLSREIHIDCLFLWRRKMRMINSITAISITAILETTISITAILENTRCISMANRQ